jgi:peptide-methionine (S)-S-oxide reductase
MAIIFFHNEEQKRLAMETKQRQAGRAKGKIFTEVVPFTAFYAAELYHQKYSLQQEPDLMKEFKAMYPETNDFTNSTAAARINGYLGGYGTVKVLQTEIDSYGLSPAGKERLLSLLKQKSLTPGCRL